MKTRNGIIMILCICVLFFCSSCLTATDYVSSGKDVKDSAAGAVKSKKELFSWAKNDLEEAGLYSSLISSDYKRETEMKISLLSDRYINFLFNSKGNGVDDLRITLESDGETTKLSGVYSYTKFNKTRASDGDGGLNGEPAYLVFSSSVMEDVYSVVLTKTASDSVLNFTLSDELVRFIMNCTSAIRVDIYTEDRKKVETFLYNYDYSYNRYNRDNSYDYYHSYDATKLKTLIKAYYILRAYGGEKKISASMGKSYFIYDYLEPKLSLNYMQYGLAVEGKDFYLLYRTSGEFKRSSYGLSDTPVCLLLSVSDEEESLLLPFDNSGRYRLNQEDVKYIFTRPSSSKITVRYYTSGMSNIYRYYKDTNDDRVREYTVDSISVSSALALLNMYNRLYSCYEKIENYRSLYSSSSGIVYASSTPLFVNKTSGKMFLEYHTYEENLFNLGFEKEIGYLMLKRSDGESIVLSVGTSGRIELTKNVISFINGSAPKSKIEITSYDKNKNTLRWKYVTESGGTTTTYSHTDYIDSDSAKELISYYISLNNPLDAWEIDYTYAVDWILGLD